MTHDAHEQARQLIALGESLAAAEETWLRSHLQDCQSCRNYADSTARLIRSLRSVPLAASPRLVHSTQRRVRLHADRLRQARERMWLVGMACLGVGLSAAVTAPLLWRLFAWIGEQAGVANPVWQAGFVFFFIAPALVVSVLLLARGTHLKSDEERSRQW